MRSMVPAMGVRLTWTLKTFINTLTRVQAGSRPSSGGGAVGPTKQQTPSAGQMTRSSVCGMLRTGSRKNQMAQSERGRPMRETRPPTAGLRKMAAREERRNEPRKNAAMMIHPSRAIGGYWVSAGRGEPALDWAVGDMGKA